MTRASRRPHRPRLAVSVAGLGRAPLLVALGLMEIGKIGPVEAVQYIRAQRRGAINAHQLRFLEQYEPRRAKVGCVIE